MSIKVSVIIPVYNSEKFIRETIESVLNQTYYDFEIITVDDGSTDKSADIINSFNDKRISYVYQKNQGISGARNTAISESKGEYIALLDHDDLWLPQKLEKQIPLLENNDKVGLVYSDCYNVDVDEKVIVRSFEQAKPFRGRVLSHLFGTGFIPCLTAVMKKEV
ncbi:MAG: glycosyltransferase family 2 protein, partial [Candidatus Omnitrophica bacterium]|nr:glycosyltransferase family 2 protein [Candidatus Omnitrophota bacterium]